MNIEKSKIFLQQQTLTARQLTFVSFFILFYLMSIDVWLALEMAHGFKGVLLGIVDLHVHRPGAFDSVPCLVYLYFNLLRYVGVPAIVVFVSLSVFVHIIKNKNANKLSVVTILAPVLLTFIASLMMTMGHSFMSHFYIGHVPAIIAQESNQLKISQEMP